MVLKTFLGSSSSHEGKTCFWPRRKVGKHANQSNPWNNRLERSILLSTSFATEKKKQQTKADIVNTSGSLTETIVNWKTFFLPLSSELNLQQQRHSQFEEVFFHHVKRRTSETRIGVLHNALWKRIVSTWCNNNAPFPSYRLTLLLRQHVRRLRRERKKASKKERIKTGSFILLSPSNGENGRST